MDIEGAVVLVTGANRGIGRALVERFAANGAKRVYAAAREPTAIVAKSDVTPIALDVTSPEDVRRVGERCSDVTILVNNAGVSLGQPLIGAESETFAEREMAVNYFGVLRMCRAFAPILAANGGGAIVNVLSILARANMPRVGSYCASKAASLSLTQGVRGELAKQGTFVTAILPAFVDTDMAAHVSAPKLAPEHVADAAIQALRERLEEAYPGQAREIAAQLDKDAKAVERQFAAMFPVR
jgi:NAD(P)-dependent dehydrogenase (short-subunit alcohol dehydrogenase family)